jgi:hypothetical protein
MAQPMPEEIARKQRELMVRVARSPEFSCCCIRLPKEDRRRAKRVFRLTRRLERAWEKEHKERVEREAEGRVGRPD